MKLYTITDDYINFLYDIDNMVLFNKDGNRKYLGVVLCVDGFDYFVPLSSPKDGDYEDKVIKKDSVTTMRIVYPDVNNVPELKGTLKFNNMIPVPKEVLTYYDINKESDLNYKTLVIKELMFIKDNVDKIKKKADVLYKQKTKNYSFKHLKYTLDFKKLEIAMLDYKKE